MTRDGSSSARFVARLKTLTTVNQLDPARKTFLLQSLFEANLIVNQYNTRNLQEGAIISLEDANLSEIDFQNRALRYLSLPRSNLTRANFLSSQLSCANLQSAVLIEANFHETAIFLGRSSCFGNFGYTNFGKAILINADLSQAEFISTDLTGAILTYANMRWFLCLDCVFLNTDMYRTDLSFASVLANSTFISTNLTETILESTSFKDSIFHAAKFMKNLAIRIKIDRCSLVLTEFQSCVIQQALIRQSNFSQTHFNNVTLIESTVTDVQFINTTMQYTNLTSTIFTQCTFINVNFTDAVTQNASFLNCTFQQSLISQEQLLKATSFEGSIFL